MVDYRHGMRSLKIWNLGLTEIKDGDQGRTQQMGKAGDSKPPTKAKQKRHDSPGRDIPSH